MEKVEFLIPSRKTVDTNGELNEIELIEVEFIGKHRGKLGRYNSGKNILGTGGMSHAVYEVGGKKVDKLIPLGKIIDPDEEEDKEFPKEYPSIEISGVRYPIESRTRNRILSVVSEYNILQIVRGCSNILQIDPNFTEGGPLFGTDGESLYALIRTSLVKGLRLDNESLNLTLDDLAEVTIDITTALQSLAAKEIVNSDLKPSNIIYDRDKEIATLIDFGLAFSLREDESKFISEDLKEWVKKRGVLEEGNHFGTPKYFSPENINKKFHSPGSDLFSFGATLYNLITNDFIGSNRCNNLIARYTYIKNYNDEDRKETMQQLHNNTKENSRFRAKFLPGVEAILDENPGKRSLQFLRDCAKSYLSGQKVSLRERIRLI